MARQSSALRVVQQQPEREPVGDETLTREAMSGWKEGQRKCRARGRHNWGAFTVWEHATFYEVVEQCTLCRNRRSAPYSKTGRKLDRWKAEYRDGYLLPKGATPLRDAEDLKDELVLSDILSRKVVEVLDDDEK